MAYHCYLMLAFRDARIKSECILKHLECKPWFRGSFELPSSPALALELFMHPEKQSWWV